MRLVIAAALAFTGLCVASAADAQAVEIALQPNEVLLKVEAQGEHLSRPDQMTIVAGVVTTGGTAREALQANNSLAARLIEAVRANGIEARDVRTARLSVEPQFAEDENRAQREGRRPRILGYVANNQLELRLRDLDRAGEIIGALFSAGANSVSGPRFGHSDPKPAQAEARKAAIANAQAEAAAYADALGMRISRILRVSQRGDFNREDESSIVVTGSRIATPIQPGEIATRVQVWIDYALLPM